MDAVSRLSVSLGFTCCHSVSLGVTRVHLVSLGITCYHLVSLGFTWTWCYDTWCHSVSLGVTWYHSVSLRPHSVSLGVTWYHFLVSLGLTWCHSVSPKPGSHGFLGSFPHDLGSLRCAPPVGRSIFSPFGEKKTVWCYLDTFFCQKKQVFQEVAAVVVVAAFTACPALFALRSSTTLSFCSLDMAFQISSL